MMEIRLRRSPGVVVPYRPASRSDRFGGPMRLSSRRSEPLSPSAIRAVAASTFGVLLVAIVSATPRSPYYPVLPDGVEAQGPLRWIADAIGLQHLGDGGLMIVGLVAVAVAAFGFILILRESWNRRISMRLVFVARDRVPRPGAHAAPVVLARRLQLRVLRTHREHLRRRTRTS